MQIVEKYRKILEKPMAEPFRGYIQELIDYISGDYLKKEKPPYKYIKPLSMKKEPRSDVSETVSQEETT